MVFPRCPTATAQCILALALASLCAAALAGSGRQERVAVHESALEYSFDIWNWTAPAQDLTLFEKWAADLKGIGLTRLEISVAWNALEPQPHEIDLSYIRDRLAICKKHGLGMLGYTDGILRSTVDSAIAAGAGARLLLPARGRPSCLPAHHAFRPGEGWDPPLISAARSVFFTPLCHLTWCGLAGPGASAKPAAR